MTINSTGEFRNGHVRRSPVPAAHSDRSFPTRVFTQTGIEFGCDYNPEQWAPEVWIEDVGLMREAGVTLVAVNIFGWALLEPRPGEFHFDELDRIVQLLHDNGIGINLGTGTSSPPPWLTTLHPEVLPAAEDGTTRWPGGRQAWCPSSPVFREYALRLAREVARRYGAHPSVRLWHVSNELGCHNALCYCDVSARSFRRWLVRRYETVGALNAAWGTTFWSQRYGSFDEILPPRATISSRNPGQVLDFARFSSDEVLSYYLAESEIVRSESSVPVTTNFMVTAHIRTLDYWRWAPHVDIVANDHYLDHRLRDPLHELSFSADLTRGLAQGAPWLLMEQATGAVNWQPRNIAKVPGEMIRNSLTHLARGADGICFFQWRASAQGSEKFHSGMVPHAGTDSETWREVLVLGGMIGRLREVLGSRVVADVAMVFSWEAWWATDLDSRPSRDVQYIDQVHRIYRALWESGITVDLVAPGADLSDYRLVVVPTLSLVTDADSASISRFVENGGTALVTFLSGIVDENDRIRLGGYPGAFRELLGISIDEFFPLDVGETVALDDGSSATIWTERIRLRGADAVASYTNGPVAGMPAITRHQTDAGASWYVGTSLDAADLTKLVLTIADQAGIATHPEFGRSELELVRRRSTHHEYVFAINHGGGDVTVPIVGHELIHDETVGSGLLVPAGEVRVVRTAAFPDEGARS